MPRLKVLQKSNQGQSEKILRSKITSNWFSKVLPVALLILLGSIAYNKFVAHNEHHERSTISISSYAAKDENKKIHSCTGEVYCSEMISCDESRFYQSNCPGTKLDGDGDGIPCESQWCSL